MEGKERKKMGLTTKIFIGLIAGLIVGVIFNIAIPHCYVRDTVFVEGIFYVIGNGFIRLMKMLVVPLVFALWLRYLQAIDDNGNTFELSPDPLLDECKALAIDDILHRTDIFGVDLFEAGLAPKVKEYFNQLTAGNGAVRKLLQSL